MVISGFDLLGGLDDGYIAFLLEATINPSDRNATCTDGNFAYIHRVNTGDSIGEIIKYNKNDLSLVKRVNFSTSNLTHMRILEHNGFIYNIGRNNNIEKRNSTDLSLVSETKIKPTNYINDFYIFKGFLFIAEDKGTYKIDMETMEVLGSLPSYNRAIFTSNEDYLFISSSIGILKIEVSGMSVVATNNLDINLSYGFVYDSNFLYVKQGAKITKVSAEDLSLIAEASSSSSTQLGMVADKGFLWVNTNPVLKKFDSQDLSEVTQSVRLRSNLLSLYKDDDFIFSTTSNSVFLIK